MWNYFISFKMIMLNIGVILFLSHFNAVNSVAIMSVDFGSEWMKIAVVAPGIPMEIALNAESKRKTASAISFRHGERAFGEDALNVGRKAPVLSYSFLLDLLGKKINNPVVELFKKRFPHYQIEAHPERGSVVFRESENVTRSVEELVAQLLGHAKEIATSYTDQQTKDIVITVPPFFNQAERNALLDAAQLAGLKVLALMPTTSAFALKYGMFRRKEINETAQNILIYAMGASSTTAVVASYQKVKTKERGYTETHPQVSILGLGFDRTLGGLEMQIRLRNLLAKRFNEEGKTKNDVFKSPKALAKLLREAEKLKQILSANNEHLVQIEGVLDDQDLKTIVTREDFENLCGDIFERVRYPLDAALVSAEIDLADINQFIIVGGNTRVPKIQEILQNIWGKELGKILNFDEDAAIGAVYRAADMGQGFKVMKFLMREAVIYPVEVDFERTVTKEDGSLESKSVKRALYALRNHYPQKKIMTFNKHTNDFGFAVNYGDLSHFDRATLRTVGSEKIFYVMVEGVTAAFEKHANENTEPKGIKAHFNLDDSGLLQLTSIEAVFEKNVTGESDEKKDDMLSKISDTISQFKLWSADEKEENGTTEEDSQKAGKENGNKKTNETNKDSKKEKVKEEDKKPRIETIKEALSFKITRLDFKPLSDEDKKASIEKIHKVLEEEKLRKENDMTRNNLESYLHEIHDKFLQDEYISASKEEDRDALLKKVTEYQDFLEEEEKNEETSVYSERLTILRSLFEPVKSRVKEAEERPEAIKALKGVLNGSEHFLSAAKKGPDYFTEGELNALGNMIEETKKWLEDTQKLQAESPAHEDPVLSLNSVAEKIHNLDREVKYLVGKGRIAKAKKDKELADRLAAEKLKTEKEKKAKAKKQNETKTAEKNEGQEDKDETESQVETGETPASETDIPSSEYLEKSQTIDPDETQVENETHTEL